MERCFPSLPVNFENREPSGFVVAWAPFSRAAGGSNFSEIFNIAFLSRCCDLLAVIDQFLQFCRNFAGNLQEFFSIFPRVTARAVMCKVNEGRSAAKGDGNEHGD